MATPRRISLLLSFFACAFHSPAEAQSFQSEVQLRAPDAAQIEVAHFLAHSLNSDHLLASTSRRIRCPRPCSFVLNVPSLRVPNSTTPARPGLERFARASVYLSGASIIFGGTVVYMDRNQGIDRRGIVQAGRWSIGLGVPLLIVSIIGLIAGWTRPVDRFEF